MRRALRAAGPLLWTLAIGFPASYAALYIVEGIYDVPLSVENFRFERPWAALMLPAGLLALLSRGWLLKNTAPRLQVSRGRELLNSRPSLRMWLRDSTVGMRASGLSLMAVALMGPQSIHARDQTELEGIDIVITLDASLSMRASDIRPNRFAGTKAVVDEFIQRRPDDRIGAVLFGRDAYTLLPLTSDKQALRTMIAELELGMVDGRGTAIGNAIATSLNRLRSSDAKSKVIILLTDGESNSGNVSPDQAADFAHTMGVKVYSVLMGRSGDATVQQGLGLGGMPIFDRGDFPVNPELLQHVAERTGGEYFQVTDREGLERSFHTILDRLEKSAIEDAGRVYGELFPAFLWPAFLLLGFELLSGTMIFRRWP